MSHADGFDPRVLRWSGGSATSGIGQLEARLAAGARFGVLVTSAERWERHEALLLEQWHRAAGARMEALCVGWATVMPDVAVRPALLVRPAPGAPAGVASAVHADSCAALSWLRRRLR